MQVADKGGSGSIRPDEALSTTKLKPPAFSQTMAVVASAPKLDEFPSPQPLSEQEKMLAEYVAEHHQQAALVARARMADLKEDWIKEMQATATTAGRPTSDQSVSQQEDR